MADSSGVCKKFGGIDSPFVNAIAPVRGAGEGASVKDVGGVDVRDGSKGDTGEMPEVSGVNVPGETSVGTGRPAHLPGS